WRARARAQPRPSSMESRRSDSSAGSVRRSSTNSSSTDARAPGSPSALPSAVSSSESLSEDGSLTSTVITSWRSRSATTRRSQSSSRRSRTVRTIPEGPIFERFSGSRPGFQAFASDPSLDAIGLEFDEREGGFEGFGQAAEVEVVRHYTRLSALNYDIDR